MAHSNVDIADDSSGSVSSYTSSHASSTTRLLGGRRPSNLRRITHGEGDPRISFSPRDVSVSLSESRDNAVDFKQADELMRENPGALIQVLEQAAGTLDPQVVRVLRDVSARLYREGVRPPLVSRRDLIRAVLTVLSESALLVITLLASEAGYAHWATGRHLPVSTDPYWHTTYILILAGGAFSAFFFYANLVLRPLFEARFSRFQYEGIFHSILGVTRYVPIRMVLELASNILVAFYIAHDQTPENLLNPSIRIETLLVAMLAGLWAGLIVRAVSEMLDRCQEQIRTRIVLPGQRGIAQACTCIATVAMAGLMASGRGLGSVGHQMWQGLQTSGHWIAHQAQRARVALPTWQQMQMLLPRAGPHDPAILPLINSQAVGIGAGNG